MATLIGIAGSSSSSGPVISSYIPLSTTVIYIDLHSSVLITFIQMLTLGTQRTTTFFLIEENKSETLPKWRRQGREMQLNMI